MLMKIGSQKVSYGEFQRSECQLRNVGVSRWEPRTGTGRCTFRSTISEFVKPAVIIMKPSTCAVSRVIRLQFTRIIIQDIVPTSKLMFVGNCYEKVKTETEEIRKQIEMDIGNNVEDKGVIVLYKNEKELMDATKMDGRMIVEVPKLRPAWFSTNLLQKTTAEPDPVTTTVTTTKPNLG